jgi:hypothetical protein
MTIDTVILASLDSTELHNTRATFFCCWARGSATGVQRSKVDYVLGTVYGGTKAL